MVATAAIGTAAPVRPEEGGDRRLVVEDARELGRPLVRAFRPGDGTPAHARSAVSALQQRVEVVARHPFQAREAKSIEQLGEARRVTDCWPAEGVLDQRVELEHVPDEVRIPWSEPTPRRNRWPRTSKEALVRHVLFTNITPLLEANLVAFKCRDHPPGFVRREVRIDADVAVSGILGRGPWTLDPTGVDLVFQTGRRGTNVPRALVRHKRFMPRGVATEEASEHIQCIRSAGRNSFHQLLRGEVSEV